MLYDYKEMIYYYEHLLNTYDAKRMANFLFGKTWINEKGFWKIKGDMLIIQRTHQANDYDPNFENWYYTIISISHKNGDIYEYENGETFNNDVIPTELYKQIMNN